MPNKFQLTILIKNALTWVRGIKQIGHRLSPSRLPHQIAQFFQGTRLVDEWLLDAHFLIVAFRQVEEYLKSMGSIKSQAFQIACKNYLKEYRKKTKRDLRNILEHQVEYIVEAKSRKMSQNKLILDKKSPILVGCGSMGREQIIQFTIFGKKYRIDHLVASALALEKPLYNLKRSKVI